MTDAPRDRGSTAAGMAVAAVSLLVLGAAGYGSFALLRSDPAAPVPLPPAAPAVEAAPTTQSQETAPAVPTVVVPAAAQPPQPAATPRAPTAADAADFAVAFQPPGATGVEAVAADVDSDGNPEVVVVSLVGGRSHLDVARWSGVDYVLQPVTPAEGGSGDAVSVTVRDVNGTPETREILVRQTTAAGGDSVSLWGVDAAGAIVPLVAVEGCWAGSHTYGADGAVVQGQRITARCDGAPAPPEEWTADVYLWDPEQAAYVYELTEEDG